MREREREIQTHYDIQMERRAADVEEWNRNRKVMAYARRLRMSHASLRNASCFNYHAGRYANCFPSQR
jgi:hypothetical protein